MNTAIPTLLRAAATIMFAFVLAGTAVAVERPPVRPEQQRAWLADCLVADMRSEIAETVGLVGALTDEQVVLLVRLYILTREMAERDVWLYAVEPSETLVRLRRQIRRAYRELATISPGCRNLCEVAYATVPGWCVRWRHVVPDWYFRSGCYVGPVVSARFAGAYSVRAYRAYHDHGSHSDWRSGQARFGADIGKLPKPAHGMHHRYAAAGKHSHPKALHGKARTTRHGRAGATKHGGPRKGSHGAARSAKHGGSSPKARHRSPRSKFSPHSQPHRQRPKQGTRAPKWRATAHPQHAAHGQAPHKGGRARHK